MEFVKDETFDNYIESYKKLPLRQKKQLAIEEFNKLLILLERINKEMNNGSKILFNREILDIKKENCDEGDFVEAVYVYIHSIQESLADYVESVTQRLGG